MPDIHNATIRETQPSDVPAILGMIRELAEYERLLKQTGFQTVVGCRTSSPLDAILAKIKP